MNHNPSQHFPALPDQKTGWCGIAPPGWHHDWPEGLNEDEKLEFQQALWDMWDMSSTVDFQPPDDDAYAADEEYSCASSEDDEECSCDSSEDDETGWRQAILRSGDLDWSVGIGDETTYRLQQEDEDVTDIEDNRDSCEDEEEESEDEVKEWRRLVTGSTFLPKGLEGGLTVME
jgi:hypothetical protein